MIKIGLARFNYHNSRFYRYYYHKKKCLRRIISPFKVKFEKLWANLNHLSFHLKKVQANIVFTLKLSNLIIRLIIKIFPLKVLILTIKKGNLQYFFIKILFIEQ